MWLLFLPIDGSSVVKFRGTHPTNRTSLCWLFLPFLCAEKWFLCWHYASLMRPSVWEETEPEVILNLMKFNAWNNLFLHVFCNLLFVVCQHSLSYIINLIVSVVLYPMFWRTIWTFFRKVSSSFAFWLSRKWNITDPDPAFIQTSVLFLGTPAASSSPERPFQVIAVILLTVYSPRAKLESDGNSLLVVSTCLPACRDDQLRD